MLTLEDQFMVEEAWMAEAEAKHAKQKAGLVRLWKEAQEEVKRKAEEEWRWKEEEERVAEERRQKEEEEKRRVDKERKWKEEADKKAQERKRREAEEQKRMEGERKCREEEEVRRQIEIEKDKQRKIERWELGKNREDPVEEVEWRRWVEVRIREQQVGKQMTWAPKWKVVSR